MRTAEVDRLTAAAPPLDRTRLPSDFAAIGFGGGPGEGWALSQRRVDVGNGDQDQPTENLAYALRTGVPEMSPYGHQ
jgi:hypothetical protein